MWWDAFYLPQQPVQPWPLPLANVDFRRSWVGTNCKVPAIPLPPFYPSLFRTVVDFRRIWAWDGNGDGSGPGISIWRPLPSPGYVTLGDCLERGWDPPVSACVVQDTGEPACRVFGHQPNWEAAVGQQEYLLARPGAELPRRHCVLLVGCCIRVILTESAMQVVRHLGQAHRSPGHGTSAYKVAAQVFPALQMARHPALARHSPWSRRLAALSLCGRTLPATLMPGWCCGGRCPSQGEWYCRCCCLFLLCLVRARKDRSYASRHT